MPPLLLINHRNHSSFLLSVFLRVLRRKKHDCTYSMERNSYQVTFSFLSALEVTRLALWMTHTHTHTFTVSHKCKCKPQRQHSQEVMSETLGVLMQDYRIYFCLKMSAVMKSSKVSETSHFQISMECFGQE